MTHPNFRLQKVKHTLAKVNALASEMRGMSDEELKHQTVVKQLMISYRGHLRPFGKRTTGF